MVEGFASRQEDVCQFRFSRVKKKFTVLLVHVPRFCRDLKRYTLIKGYFIYF